MRKLANFAAFEIAEKVLTKDIEALERLHARDAEKSQMHEKLTQALRDLREGPSGNRTLHERCKVRERVSA